jgi:hypothetical protein
MRMDERRIMRYAENLSREGLLQAFMILARFTYEPSKHVEEYQFLMNKIQEFENFYPEMKV